MIDNSRNGFTLIELSIVLVIIGLIVGGVLVGRDLIEAAQMRAAVSQLARFDAAVNTFEGKYACLPGDCANASDFLTITQTDPTWTDDDGFGNASLNGNGNGIIDVDPSQNWYAPGLGWNIPEPSRFFASLYTAGLINDSYNSGEGANIPGSCGVDVLFPVSPLRGRVAVYTNAVTYVSIYDSHYSTHPDGVSYYLVGIGIDYVDFCTIVMSSVADVPGTWTPIVAMNFDQKIDDGLPMTGAVRATTGDGVEQNVLLDPVPGYTSTYFPIACVNASSAYNTATSGSICALRVRTSW